MLDGLTCDPIFDPKTRHVVFLNPEMDRATYNSLPESFHLGVLL